MYIHRLIQQLLSCSRSTPTLRFTFTFLRHQHSCTNSSASYNSVVAKNSNTMEVDEDGVKSLQIENKPSSGTNEGKVTIQYDKNKKIFYNPIQEINRDISILGINTYIERQIKEDAEREAKTKRVMNRKFQILEAMAASGIRSIRYAKEIGNVTKILANDLSPESIESLKQNSILNETTDIIEPSCEDASLLMLSRRNQFYVVDLDPYGSPIPCLDSAIQCVADGGLLLVTATDMAVIAGGNNPETCYSKYGSMPLKTKACQEMALRILIHAVQSFANRYGKYVEPVLSLKIDFYIRVFFRVVNSPISCKQVALQTSMVYQCIGCHTFSYQRLGAQKGPGHYITPKGPPVGLRCDLCDSAFHVGGPLWTGPLHNKDFVADMDKNVNSERFEYLGTRRRIQGLLKLVLEELETPFYYETSQICSIIRCKSLPLISLRSAILNLGYRISGSHAAAGTFKTDAPNNVIYEMLLQWRRLGNDEDAKVKEGTPGFKLIQALDSKDPADRPSFDFTLHPAANPASKEAGVLRYQTNPTRFWGPGSRASTKVLEKDSGTLSKNQERQRNKKLKQNQNEEEPKSSGDEDGGGDTKRTKYTTNEPESTTTTIANT